MKNRKPLTDKAGEVRELTPNDMKLFVPVSHLPDSLQKKLRGRPAKDGKKTAVSLRIRDDVLEKWRATGPGWQTRMAEVLARQVISP